MKVTVSKAAGLFTSPNVLSSVPEGGMKRATNCVINFPNTIESRRGFEYLDYRYGASIDRASQLLTYQGVVLVQYGDKLAYDSGSALIDYSGTNEPPAASVLRMKSAEMASNLYITTKEGIKVIDEYTATPIPAGNPRGPVPTTRAAATKLAGNPGDGWFPADRQVAYIGVVGKRDVNDNVVLGEGSNPFFVVNPADVNCPGGTTLPRATKQEGTDAIVVQGDWLFGEHNFSVGDKITATFDLLDTDFVSGTYTVTAVDGTSFTFHDGATAGGSITAAHASTITSGAKNVSVNFDVSPELTTENFIQIYRSTVSLNANTEPNADYFLVNEVQLTSAIISARAYSFTDTTADSLLLSAYYGNANIGYEIPDGSPDNDNGRPPKANDLETWDERLWGANYIERQNLIINLLGVGSPNGVQVGDTINIAGITYTAVAESATITDDVSFRVYDTAWYLPSFAVRSTAESLALAVTHNVSSPVNCYYTSTEDETPGELFLEARAAGADSFDVYVSRPASWNPEMGSTSGTAETSTADAATNSVWMSKKGEPEAVPRLNRILVGPRNGRILRIKALTSRLYVFTDKAIYTISGSFPYRVDLLSKTALLVAPDTLVDLDDALFGLTTQGTARITDSGVGILSVPVEADLKRLFGEALSTLKVKAQAVGYESYNKYILSLPTEQFDTENTQSLVYDVKTETWTRWDKPINAAVIVPQTDYLFIARNDGNTVSKERKTYTRWDYVDESFAVTVEATNATAKTVTLTSATGVEAGDLLYQSALCNALVESVSGNVVTLRSTEAWVVGLDTRCYKAIQCELMYAEQFADKPNESKHFREVCYHFKTPGISSGEALFTSELNPSDAPVDMGLSGWGDGGGWGNFAWLQPAGPKNRRVMVPINATRSAYLGVGFRVTEALGVWALYGYTAEFETMSERNSK